MWLFCAGDRAPGITREGRGSFAQVSHDDETHKKTGNKQSTCLSRWSGVSCRAIDIAISIQTFLHSATQQENFYAGQGDDFIKMDMVWGLNGALLSPHLSAHKIVFGSLSVVLHCSLEFDRTGYNKWYPNKNRGKVVGCLFARSQYFFIV